MSTGKKALVFPCDTLFGRHLCAMLTTQGYTVQGIASDTASPPKGSIPRSDLPALKKALLEADVVVYQAHGSVQDPTNALKMLSHSHYENPKTFVLVSSVMTWFETRPLEAPDADPTEKKEMEALTEDQYNKRVPHAKYLVWKEVEKLCRNVNTVKLQTYVMFAGLTYGNGEEMLHPLFKQAWHLSPEGLPMFGNGSQLIPMIHTNDLVNAVVKVCGLPEPLEQRYIFAVDEGAVSYSAFVTALNATMGPATTFAVKEKELMLFQNVEFFTVNLKLEPGQINVLLGDEWQCKSGIVENIARVTAEYKKERKVEPLKVCLLGGPSTGKSFFGRELSLWYKVPHFTISDIIADYTYQEIELKETLESMRATLLTTKRNDKIMEKKKAKLEEMKEAERNAAGIATGEDGAVLEKTVVDPDAEDSDEMPEITVTLEEAEEKEIADAVDAEDDDNKQKYNARLEEIKKVLAMKIKSASSEANEAPNPKKKPPPKVKGKAEEAVADSGKVDAAPRYTDRALTLMVRWKLDRMESRNQGYILDGYPKSVRQTQMLFQDMPVEILEDPEEIQRDITADVEEKPCDERLFPGYVLHLKASDTFLLERVQKIQDEAPHNTPEDFQRRLEAYKTNFENPKSVVLWLESTTFTASKRKPSFIEMNVETCPLVLAPTTVSQYAPKQWDQMLLHMTSFIGPAHNFGVTPQEAKAEKDRERTLGEEKRTKALAEAQVRAGAESADRESVQQRRRDEERRLATMKAHEREMLEARKEPMKKYLMDNVIPVLTKGLIEICERRPEDPVDALAEWLFRHNPTEVHEF